MTDWTSNANDVLTLRLVHTDHATSSEDPIATPFHPRFTYPIFGDEEKIYGYQGLVVNLLFSSGSLAMCLNIQSTARLPASTKDDIEGILYKFIPSDYLKNETDFKKRVQDDAISFRPCGSLIYSYSRPSLLHLPKNDKEYNLKDDPGYQDSIFEVYHNKWDTPGFLNLHRRMQIFILLYIEAGSYIQEDEDKWQFLVLYERRRRRGYPDTFHFVGYCSMYPFFFWPDKVRLRLSQFVILPPYQNQGHGAHLYTALHQHVMATPSIAELTIEDPSEAFEDLRDKTDLKFLLRLTDFIKEGYGFEERYEGKGKERFVIGGKLGPPADKVWVETWRKKLKIASRQFDRLIEMLILRKLDPVNEGGLRAFRLQVKERLYRFNFEILVTLDEKERKEKLEETFQSVIDGYQVILSLIG
ncbi:acyl-CoA N-acyltransferase [Cantharellus anzutake]|uniref:acyl-CoA N-acyltransferase n=1 Tax=Cantharellus anzutake TaxID=1750568 RepID=UPI001903CD00|nr:acyl-CoA N-acyltransferase [Cantharellus anzutake]KAF8344073.1 acyl-CoA N-acyltransferase [Cantharellus anzutake]